jgi:hypothetical protein
MSRRQMLKSAACGIGYIALADLCARAYGVELPHASLPPQEGGTEAPKHYQSPLMAKVPPLPARAKRVIFLFMQGAPSHVDTFDYKPKLIEDDGKSVGGRKLLAPQWKFKPYGKSGLYISDLFPNIGQHADDICLINGMHTDNPAHPQATIALHTGTATFVRPSVGAWVLYGLGTLNQNLPGFITINPPSGLGGAQNYGSAFLPATFQGTRVDASGVADIASRITKPMQRRQIDLVQQMNHDFAARSGPNEQLDGLIESYELGFRMQGTVPDVMDISKESRETLELYGIEGAAAPQIGKGGKKAGNGENFGKQCLMARRLAEAGVRFIEVCHPGWDQHQNLKEALTRNCASTDKAIGGLLTDLAQRGLLKDTLVVWGGEFGRTPAAQGTDGRNHNNRGFSMWMAGGGVKGGMAYGKTDDYGAAAVENPMHMHDLHATVLALLGLDHEKLTFRYAGRDFRLTDVYGNVAKEIIA